MNRDWVCIPKYNNGNNLETVIDYVALTGHRAAPCADKHCPFRACISSVDSDPAHQLIFLGGRLGESLSQLLELSSAIASRFYFKGESEWTMLLSTLSKQRERNDEHDLLGVIHSLRLHASGKIQMR